MRHYATAVQSIPYFRVELQSFILLPYGSVWFTTKIVQERCILINQNENSRLISVVKKRKSDGLYLGQILVVPSGRNESLYSLRTVQNESCNASWNGSEELWHKRLAHVSMKVVKEVVSSFKY